MGSVIMNAVVASLVLTALINVIPRLFPGSSAEDRIRDLVGEPRTPDQLGHSPNADSAETRPKFRIWFPWKSMIIGSLLITIVVNVIAFLD